MCTRTQHNKFLCLIGKCQFFITLIKNNRPNNILFPEDMHLTVVRRRNNSLRGLFAIYNILAKMCRHVSGSVPLHRIKYDFYGPMPVMVWPLFTTQYCVQCIQLLREFYSQPMGFVAENDQSQPRKKIHFYSYLLTKITNLLELFIPQ